MPAGLEDVRMPMPERSWSSTTAAPTCCTDIIRAACRSVWAGPTLSTTWLIPSLTFMMRSLPVPGIPKRFRERSVAPVPARRRAPRRVIRLRGVVHRAASCARAASCTRAASSL